MLDKTLYEFCQDLIKNPEPPFKPKQEQEIKQDSEIQLALFQRSSCPYARETAVSLYQKIKARMNYVRVHKTIPRIRKENQGDWLTVEVLGSKTVSDYFSDFDGVANIDENICYNNLSEIQRVKEKLASEVCKLHKQASWFPRHKPDSEFIKTYLSS